MLENIQALKKLFLSVSAEKEEINKDNQQKFDELSERLKSIEASISKIQKSNEETQKPKDDSKKESINESLVPTDNTTNGLSESEKRFKLKHVFKNVNKFEDDKQNFSEWEDHFNVNSRMCVARRNNHLGFYVQCEPVVPTDIWSIQTKIELKIVQKNRKDVIETMNYCYEKIIGHGFPEFLEWEQLEKEYIVEGNLTVEAHVSIIQTTGLGKEKNRLFDESQKDVSDVVMVVRGIKFFVSKMFLASQSSVFKALLLGSFSESKQSEVSLNGIDPDDFHFFLEVLYGESAINDANVEGMTLLADMYDSPTAIRRCEEFLLKESKKKLVKKLDIAIRYHLEKLKKKCMSEIVILEDQAVVPKHAYR
ncbi:hypothetical protein B9Z55_006799 [Caenorhabditis nigoni]|nr:hypothetical protein B9Z55_006799 [Caenorhabditis nigoni]